MASYDDTATVSGTVVSIENGADDVPTKSIVVTIPPTLSGVSLLTETQTGRNFLDDTLSNLEQGSINGTTGANENANNRVRNANAIPFPYDKIVSSYTWTIPSGYKVAIRPYDKDGNFVQLPSWALAFITQLPQDLIGQGITQMKFVLAKTDNSAITPSDIANIGFQIELGSTAHAYEPYQTPTQYTASLGRTIYGGQADIVNGTGTETYEKIVFNADNKSGWQLSNGIFYYDVTENSYTKNIDATNYICDTLTAVKQASNISDMNTRADNSIALYGNTPNYWRVFIKKTDLTTLEAFQTWISSNPVTFVYEKGTPTDFTFTGQEIPTRLGYNAFWSEQGDTELTYYKDGYGFTSVTVNKNGVSQTAKLHKVIYGGKADVIRGTCEPKNLLANLGTFPYTISATSQYYIEFSNYIQARKIPLFALQNNVTYVLSADVECSLEPFNLTIGVGDGRYLRDIANGSAQYTSGRVYLKFTPTNLTEGNNYLAFRVPRYGTTKNFEATISNVQLEIGDTASDFAPYFEPFSFPPISMSTDEGENTLFANEGDSAITYRKAVD